MSKSRTTSVLETAAAGPAENPSRQHEQAARKAKPIDLEVQPKPKRRTFTAEYKTRILREASECEPGEVGVQIPSDRDHRIRFIAITRYEHRDHLFRSIAITHSDIAITHSGPSRSPEPAQTG